MNHTKSHVQRLIDQCEQEVAPQFERIAKTVLANTARVLAAFAECRVEARHFAPSTGYGDGDIGRDTLDLLFARVFGAQDALVRPQLVSGTHALSMALQALAGAGEGVLCITGKPYDTLDATLFDPPDSLRSQGVDVGVIDLLPDGTLDMPAILSELAGGRYAYVFLQRSRGYAWRNAVSVEQIGEAVAAIREHYPAVRSIVDNCYGEFTQQQEPCHLGASLCIGSLIKNPGGGLAPTGGYFAGQSDLIDRLQYRLTAPGLGREVGSWAAGYQSFYQGLFMAPHTVGESLKGAVLAARLFEMLGYEVMPAATDERCDITQAIAFGDAQKLITFCRNVQFASPVDSHLVCEPWEMPGYDSPVIMAAGTFSQGSSLELSADAPLREPYIAYWQGGLTYEHCRLALERVAGALI